MIHTPSRSRWESQNGGVILEHRISRTYRSSEMLSPNPNMTLRIDCTITVSNDVNWMKSVLAIRLQPFRLLAEKALIMGLSTADSKGGLVEVLAIPIAQKSVNSPEVVLRMHEDDVPKCLRALSSGSDMTFILINQSEPEPPPECSFVKLPAKPIVTLALPNDLEFKGFYDAACKLVAASQDATWARHLSEGWYRKRSWID